MKGVILVVLKQTATLDTLNDPMALEDIAPEIRLLGHVLRYRCYLIGEALVDVADEATVLLNQDLHVVFVLTWRQVEDHGG